VMPPAEENQVVEVGGAAFGPGLAVMDLEEGGSPTSGEPAVMVPSDDLSPKPAREVRSDGWIEDFDCAIEQSLRLPETSPAPGWETARSVGHRLTSFTSKLPPGVDVVLVGHGLAWTILISLLTGSPPDVSAWRAMRLPDHCSLDGETIVSKWGEWI